MGRNKGLAIAFTAAAVLLSDVMCAVVAYCYCDMLWGIKYMCYSAPASAAFLMGIPYAIGILLCGGLAFYFFRKSRKEQGRV